MNSERTENANDREQEKLSAFRKPLFLSLVFVSILHSKMSFFLHSVNVCLRTKRFLSSARMRIKLCLMKKLLKFSNNILIDEQKSSYLSSCLFNLSCTIELRETMKGTLIEWKMKKHAREIFFFVMQFCNNGNSALLLPFHF